MVAAKEKPIINTKFGKAHLEKGYYVIKTSKEGNHNRSLHRLIFEDFYGPIPEGYHIHHKNKITTDNCILNLQMLRSSEHKHIHSVGENNPFYGKQHSDESKSKMSETKKGKHLNNDTIIKISDTMNSSGFYRISTASCSTCKLGFRWIYQYYENFMKKRMSATDLLKLKEKILTKGLEWKVLDESKAKLTCEKYGYVFEELT